LQGLERIFLDDRPVFPDFLRILVDFDFTQWHKIKGFYYSGKTL